MPIDSRPRPEHAPTQPPLRSGDPQYDWYGESQADKPAALHDPSWDPRQLERMSWRAEGAQDYPGGALDTLLDIAARRGRGPRHQPSDSRLHELICECLTEAPDVDASDIEVSVENAEATLRGTVVDLTQKRAAERVASCVSGIAEVHNLIRVRVRGDDADDRMSGL